MRARLRLRLPWSMQVSRRLQFPLRSPTLEPRPFPLRRLRSLTLALWRHARHRRLRSPWEKVC